MTKSFLGQRETFTNVPLKSDNSMLLPLLGEKVEMCKSRLKADRSVEMCKSQLRKDSYNSVKIHPAKMTAALSFQKVECRDWKPLYSQ